ncbi:chorismate mutase, partial [Vibrio parahaemolyticus V-223/04]
SRCKRC